MSASPHDDDASAEECLISLSELSLHTGASTRMIARFVALGLIDPVDVAREDTRDEREESRFPPEVLPRLHRMLRLRHDLNVSASSLGLVLDLLDRIDDLERELRAHAPRRRAR